MPSTELPRSTCPPAVDDHEGHWCAACHQSHGIELVAWCVVCDEAVCTFCMVHVHADTVRCPTCDPEAD